MLECLAQRFWYSGLKYLMRNKNPLFWKSARVTCVFSCDLNLKIAWKCNNTGSIVRTFACNAHISLSLFVYFEDGKWVTCLNYPLSGLHASVPRNWIAWETLWLKTNKGTSGRWLLSKDARSGTDAAMPQPETHAPVLAPAWRYTNHTIPYVKNKPNFMMFCIKTRQTCISTCRNISITNITIVNYKLMQVFNYFLINLSLP